MSEDAGQRRPRTRSMLSFSGKNRMSLVFGKSENESKEEKEAHKMHSKADPTKAINEAQPGISPYMFKDGGVVLLTR